MLDMEYKEVDLLCVEVKRSETTDKLPFLRKREIEQTHTPRSHIQSEEAVVHWVLLPYTHTHTLITFNAIISASIPSTFSYNIFRYIFSSTPIGEKCTALCLTG